MREDHTESLIRLIENAAGFDKYIKTAHYNMTSNGPITSAEPVLSCLLRLCLRECVSKI